MNPSIHIASATSFVGLVPIAMTADGSGWPTANAVVLGIATIPEPSSCAVLLAGMLTLGWIARRRR